MIGALAADASKWAEGWKLKFVIKKKKLGEVMEVEKLIGLIYWKVHLSQD